MSLDALMLVARDGALEVGTTLAPDADWSPVMFVTDDEDRMVLIACSALLSEGAGLFCAVAPVGLMSMGANAVVLVTAAWATFPERPEREEVLIFTGADRAGTTRYAFFPIERHDNAPPTLGDPLDLGTEASFDGRIIRTLLAGVRAEEAA